MELPSLTPVPAGTKFVSRDALTAAGHNGAGRWLLVKDDTKQVVDIASYSYGNNFTLDNYPSGYSFYKSSYEAGGINAPLIAEQHRFRSETTAGIPQNMPQELLNHPYFMSSTWQIVNEPVNQVPYLWDHEWGGFISHAATFASHVLANHDMHAYDLCQRNNWNWRPGTALSSEAIQRNQEALRYFRILIGHSLRKFQEWGALAPEGTVTGSADDWKSELPKMQELDSKLCDVCGGTEFAIRDFVFEMVLPLAWKLALNTIHPNVETSASGATTTTSYYRRLPEIQRTSIGVTPHPTDSVATWNGTREADLSSASYEKICIDYFNRARKLWDTDARARFDIHFH